MKYRLKYKNEHPRKFSTNAMIKGLIKIGGFDDYKEDSNDD